MLMPGLPLLPGRPPPVPLTKIFPEPDRTAPALTLMPKLLTSSVPPCPSSETVPVPVIMAAISPKPIPAKLPVVVPAALALMLMLPLDDVIEVPNSISMSRVVEIVRLFVSNGKVLPLASKCTDACAPGATLVSSSNVTVTFSVHGALVFDFPKTTRVSCAESMMWMVS